MRSVVGNWPKLVFIFLPLLILSIDAAILISERLQPETEKAIRLVKESSSRKENFTVQQYLYSTVFYFKKTGEPVTIEGWRAQDEAASNGPIVVEFAYADEAGRHVAAWEANIKEGKVTPLNQAASDLSWH